MPALEARGARVHRLVFQGGDLLDTPRRARIRVPRDAPFAAFLEATVAAHGIDTLLTFNDALPRHDAARALAAHRGLSHLVLENGYLRPHFVTLEDGSASPFPGPSAAPEPDAPRLAAPLADHARSVALHFAAAELLSPLMPYDRALYGTSVPRQAALYLREHVWRRTHAEDAADIEAHRAAGGRVSLLLLQKPGDSQLRLRSPFPAVAAVLDTVMRSFAAHAPPALALVVKQHPLDTGEERLPERFAALAAEIGLPPSRVLYRRKTPIETLLPLADSVVTVNSTGGLEALLRGVPVKCLGTAIYDRPGLTDLQPLSGFWSAPTPPERGRAEAFAANLRATSQVPGGFHTRAGRARLVPALVERLLGPA